MKAPAKKTDMCHPKLSDEAIREIIENLFSEGSATHAYSLPIESLSVPGVCRFYAVHLVIWQIRGQDLQQQFPLNTSIQRARYLAWCVIHGQGEYRALQEFDTFWSELSQPAKIPLTEWSGGISRLLQLAILGRPDLGISATLDNASDQEKALSWYYFSGGFKELHQAETGAPSWLKAFFLGQGSLTHSKFVELIYKNRSDIREAFDITTSQGLKDFNSWLVSRAAVETGLSTLVQPIKRAWPQSPIEKGSERFGVNLIGYAYGELGIGEDVRMAAHALHANNIPFTIINVSPGNNISQNDRSVEKWVSSHPIYMFNIICLTALEHLRIYLEQGRSLFSGRYNIGYWPWELHKWPAKWKHCFNLVDETWASSEHIARSLKEASYLPVRLMPMAVSHTRSTVAKNILRGKYGLPHNKTLFVFSFDGNSYIRRKNPSAIINAFTRAFPLGTENVCLIIKCMRPDATNPEWQAIRELADHDNRLLIFDITLSKKDVMELYESCDCFVSLHRAEGFGRGIAEALILHLDVIATEYGGNVEFCEMAGAMLVPHKLIPVNNGDYVEWENNYWAEPDVDAASEAMRAVHAKVQDAATHGKASNRDVELDKIFSPAVIGARYSAHLRNLTHLLARNTPNDTIL